MSQRSNRSCNNTSTKQKTQAEKAKARLGLSTFLVSPLDDLSSFFLPLLASSFPLLPFSSSFDFSDFSDFSNSPTAPAGGSSCRARCSRRSAGPPSAPQFTASRTSPKRRRASCEFHADLDFQLSDFPSLWGSKLSLPEPSAASQLPCTCSSSA